MTEINLDTIHLDKGSHSGPDDGHCFMEWCSMLAGEPFSEAPKCVSPYLRRFGIRINDRADDARRQDLKQFGRRVLNTAGDGLDEQRRWLGADHAIRTATPKWFDRAGLTDHAAKLRALTPVTDQATYDAAWTTVRDARDAAYQAQRDQFGGKSRYQYIRDAVAARLAEKPVADADAVAVADAAADADADADADAAVAVADAAVAAAAADAAADADAAVAAAVAVAAVAAAVAAAAADAAAVAAAAAAAAVAAAVADAGADAAAVAAAAAAAVAAAAAAAAAAADYSYGTSQYWEVRNAAYKAARAVYEERYADLIAESWADALALFDRLINPAVSS